MDCSSKRRKSSFSGEDELRKMSRVWMQESPGMNLQQQQLVAQISATEQQQQHQQMIHRLQQQNQMNEITLSSSQPQGIGQAPPGGPLSLQQRALAAIALQEIRSSIDPGKHAASSNNIVAQQQQSQAAQAQVQAQLFQKYQHLVQHQLKPANLNLQQANNPMLVDNRFSLPIAPVQSQNQIPLPPSIVLPNLVDTDPKALPASPQLLNIPTVIFPTSLASSPSPISSAPMRSPAASTPAPVPSVPVSNPSKLAPPGEHFQSHIPLCPNLISVSPGPQDLQQQAKSAWFTSAPATTGPGMFCHTGEFMAANLHHHHAVNVLEDQQQQQQQHASSTSCSEIPGVLEASPMSSSQSMQLQQQGSYSSMNTMSTMTLKPSPGNLMAPPPPVIYSQATPASNISSTTTANNNNNNNMISKSSRSTNPTLAEQVNPSETYKASPETCGEPKAPQASTPTMQSQQQQASQQQRPAPTRTYTKVYKLGSIGRAVDVARFKNYVELRAELSRMFGLDGQLDQRNGWQLVFVDKENDLLLVGDDPWEEFVSSVRGIRILSPKEVSYYTSDERGAESG